MRKRSTSAEKVADSQVADSQNDLIDIEEELTAYRRMRVRFAQADQRLYEISEEFCAVGNLLRLRNASPTGLLPERLSVPIQAEVEAAVNEWCLARELALRVWSNLSRAAKAKYYEAPIGEGTVH